MLFQFSVGLAGSSFVPVRFVWWPYNAPYLGAEMKHHSARQKISMWKYDLLSKESTSSKDVAPPHCQIEEEGFCSQRQLHRVLIFSIRGNVGFIWFGAFSEFI